MRVANFCWGLCTTMLVASAAQAGPDEPLGALDDSPRFMLYVHKQVGAPRHRSMGPSFGFAIDQQASARVIDLRFAPYDGGGSLFFNGMRLTGNAPEGLNWESYGGPNGAYWWGAAALAALLVGLCVTDNDPCGDSGGGGGYSPPGE